MPGTIGKSPSHDKANSHALPYISFMTRRNHMGNKRTTVGKNGERAGDDVHHGMGDSCEHPCSHDGQIGLLWQSDFVLGIKIPDSSAR